MNLDRLKAQAVKVKGSVLELVGALKKLLAKPFAKNVASKLQRMVPSKFAALAEQKPDRAPNPRRKVSKPTSDGPAAPTVDPLAALLHALEAHPQKDVLVRAGQKKDQLLRSLVPLYLVQAADVEITSGVISAFWKQQGVTYAAPNAAKALREHEGYARNTKTGRQITQEGVQYVESALAQLGRSVLPGPEQVGTT